MKGYRVRIFDPNKVILVRGKQVRTPTKFKVNEKELGMVKTIIRANSITKYTIQPIIEEVKKVTTEPLKQPPLQDIDFSEKIVAIEELEDESTLASFLKEPDEQELP